MMTYGGKIGFVLTASIDGRKTINESIGRKRNERRERHTLRSLRSYDHRCRPMGALVPSMSPSIETKLDLITLVCVWLVDVRRSSHAFDPILS